MRKKGMDLSYLTAGENIKTATGGWEVKAEADVCSFKVTTVEEDGAKQRHVGPKHSKNNTCEQHIQRCYPQERRSGRPRALVGRDCLGLQVADLCLLRKRRDLG